MNRPVISDQYTYNRYQALAEFLEPELAMIRAMDEHAGKVHNLEVVQLTSALGTRIACKRCPVGANEDGLGNEWQDEDGCVYYNGSDAESLREFLIIHRNPPTRK